MKNHLWALKKEKLNKTNLASYSNFIKKNYNFNPSTDYNKIWQWSVDNPKAFWKLRITGP